ncbi:Uncharacterised protein [Moraxella lacunata]|uniref:Uncharacterized protein n=3 Tax=Moraxella lacunata TaxID=477 RepID=A0A378QGL0_MORLA|nr:Uncharacterised protein [Moraxella lacunata]
MLNLFEPLEGYIGMNTHEYHNEFTGENWFAFKLTDDNQYEFLGNEGYFERSAIHDHKQMFGDWWFDEERKHVQECKDDYQKAQELFAKTNKLANIHSSDDEEIVQNDWLDEMGGDLSEQGGNWASPTYTPKAIDLKWQQDKLNITCQGKPLYFIAGVPAYHYGCSGADWIVLLYEPIDKIVVFTFDWS